MKPEHTGLCASCRHWEPDMMVEIEWGLCVERGEIHEATQSDDTCAEYHQREEG